MPLQRPLARESFLTRIADRFTVALRRVRSPGPAAARRFNGFRTIMGSRPGWLIVVTGAVGVAVGVAFGVLGAVGAGVGTRTPPQPRVARAVQNGGAKPTPATTGVAALAELPLITAVPAPAAPTTTMLIAVHAAGAFRRPGVYLFPLGARVDDLLVAAGGVAPDAQTEILNLAAPLSDGQRIWVPVRGQPIPPVAPPDIAAPASPSSGVGQAGGAAAVNGPDATKAVLDLNAATVEQLDALPGVGPSTAAAIVEYRTGHKRFRTVGELLNVRGIGEAKLAAMRSRVRV